MTSDAERIAEIRERCEAIKYSTTSALINYEIPWLLSQLEAVTKERDQAQAFARMQSQAASEEAQVAREKRIERDEARAEAESLWSAYTLSGSQLPPLPWKAGEKS